MLLLLLARHPALLLLLLPLHCYHLHALTALRWVLQQLPPQQRSAAAAAAPGWGGQGCLL